MFGLHWAVIPFFAINVAQYGYDIINPLIFSGSIASMGSVIGLLQTRDDVNFVYVYPTLEDLSRMVSVGIQTISIDHEKGIFTDEFPPREDDGLTFSEAVNQELQLLLSLSPR